MKLVPVHNYTLKMLRAALPSDTEVLFLHKVSELLEQLIDEDYTVEWEEGSAYEMWVRRNEPPDPQAMKEFTSLEVTLNGNEVACTECLSEMLTDYALQWEEEHWDELPHKPIDPEVVKKLLKRLKGE